MPLRRRGDAEQPVELGEQHLKRAAVAQRLKVDLRIARGQRLLRLFPDALGGEVAQLAAGRHLAHQRLGLVGDAEVKVGETRRKARHAQHAQWIFVKGVGNVAQQTRLQIALAVKGIDQLAVFPLRDGVDGQVAALQILLERHVGRGPGDEAGVAIAAFPFGARQRVFFTAVWMQKDRKIAADLLKALRQHRLRRRADHYPVPVFNRQF